MLFRSIPAAVGAANIQTYVFGSRDISTIDLSWDGAKYAMQTNYDYSLTAQIPYRPNGTWLGWERTWTTNALPARLTWGMVSNFVVRQVYKEMLLNSIPTNGNSIVVQRGKRVTQ